MDYFKNSILQIGNGRVVENIFPEKISDGLWKSKITQVIIFHKLKILFRKNTAFPSIRHDW